MDYDVNKFNNRIREYNRKKPRTYSATAKRRGEKLSKFDRAKFLCWDGEGTQVSEEVQNYSLLANSDRDYIENINGLPTEDCLNFLTLNKYTNNTIHVCFGASYDVNMILKDVPKELLAELHKGNKINWLYFELEYRARKSFTVRRYKTETIKGKKYKCFDFKKNRYIFEKSVDLWDVFGFFQKKFVAVVKEWTAGTKYENRYKHVIKDIEEGKQKRGNFTEEELESFVLPYCLNECEALRDIMIILQGYLKEAGLVLSRWDGAGAVAAAAMKLHKIKQHIRIGENLQDEAYPPEVTLAAEFAYFGGWIEAFMFGDFRQSIYHYDLRSAYPSANVDLPSLVMGKWMCIDFGNWLPLSEVYERLSNLPSYWVAHIEWSRGKEYGPNPFSWRNRKGSVTRPVQGRGWQWSPEIVASHDVCPHVQIKIKTVYCFIPDENCEKPFEFMQEAYELRSKLKAAGRGVEKVYKLYLNSIYGKLAQSLGYNKERGIKPPYHCLIYAGLVTSITRAKILRAVMQNPLAIISIATDGIYSMAPLALDIGNSLGQWEFTEHEDMTVVQPGFYWYSTKGVQQHYYRGFNEGCINRGDVIMAWHKGKEEVEVDVTRFVTLGAAIGLKDFSEWRKWRTKKRSLDILMKKSVKRVWEGATFPGNREIRIARNRIFDPRIFVEHPELLDSKKYEFDWDEDNAIWDGQASRTIIEEMYTMELSPVDE